MLPKPDSSAAEVMTRTTWSPSVGLLRLGKATK
jgi:hypothetical protein